MKSFITISADSDFPLVNLPYGIFSDKNNALPRVGTIIGDTVIDLALLESKGFFKECSQDILFNHSCLKALVAQPKKVQGQLRKIIQHLFAADTAIIREDAQLRQQALLAYSTVTMHMPGQIPNYTDFYSSIDHAKNVGCLFRDKDNPLLPNYVHLPVGYHGRASSIIASGQAFHRPKGQILPKDATLPIFSPSKALDFELEMAFFIGQGNALGQPIAIDKAAEHIFGLVVLNDWSARDLQKWEYVPLGPFLSKSFATTISPWVVTMEALEPFKVEPRVQDPKPLAYLQADNDFSVDIHLEVAIKTEKMQQAEIICRSNFSHLYWTMAQQLAHHTVAGCNTQPLDLMASGTISGPERGSFGSLLEITLGGAEPLHLSNGEVRTYLQDGDEIIMTAFCKKGEVRIGFGEARAKLLAAV